MASHIHLIVATMLVATSFLTPEGGSLSAPEEKVGPFGLAERNISVPYAFEPPVLDGWIGSNEWMSYLTLQYFDPYDGYSFQEHYGEDFTGQGDLSVSFYTLYDDTYLYFAANVTDDEIVVDSGPTYWRDDGVELLIDGAHDMDEDQRAPYPWPGFEDGTTLLTVADNSTHHDYSVDTDFERTFGEEGDWYSVARTVPEDGYYIVEMKVKLSAVAGPLPNATIGFNIGINDDDEGGDTKTALKWTGWANKTGENPAFKNETMWGRAHLESYVLCELPAYYYVDEDKEVGLNSSLCRGNHPDFHTSTNYTWTHSVFGEGGWDNITKYGNSSIWSFEDPGTYKIKLRAVDPAGIEDSSSTFIVVRDITPPELNLSDIEAYEEQPVMLVVDVMDNGILSHVNWSFFDTTWRNTTYGDTNLEHTFNHPGNYSIHVEVEDKGGNSAEGTFMVNVVDDRKPMIVGIEDVEGTAGVPFDLNASECHDDNPVYSGPGWLNYTWEIVGIIDPRYQPSTYIYYGQIVRVTLDVPGGYYATLVVEDGAGLKNFTNFDINVKDVEAPILDYDLVAEVNEGDMIYLTGAFCTDQDPFFHTSGSFVWTISFDGDPTSSHILEGESVDLYLERVGNWTVRLEAADPSGNIAILEKKVRVLDATAPHTELDLPDREDEDQPVFLDCSASRDNVGIVKLEYLVADQLTGEVLVAMEESGIWVKGIPPERYPELDMLYLVFTEPGRYVVTIRATDGMGLYSNDTAVIVILDVTPPTASLNRTYFEVYEGGLVWLNGMNSTDNVGIISFTWIIGNDTIGITTSELKWRFEKGGRYNITLLVRDDEGNTDSAYCTVVVFEREEGEERVSDSLFALFMWGLMVLFLLFLVVAAGLLMRRRKPAKEEEKKAQTGTAAPTPEQGTTSVPENSEE